MLKEIKQEIRKLQKKYIKYLDPTIQHFNIGDLAWVSWNIYYQEQVKITDVENYQKEPNDGGLIYYYYEHLGITKWQRFKMNLRFYLHIYFLMYIFKNRLYFPPQEFGPGHGVLAGRNEVLFKTRNEAKLDYCFTTVLFEISELEDLLKGD